MQFLETMERWKDFDFRGFLDGVSPPDIERIIAKERLSEKELLSLLSPAAVPFLETLARKSHELTVRNFGRVIQLYAPLYLSNVCSNECVYCGFSRKNRIGRETLTMGEIDANAGAIAATGIRHILILTGEAPAAAPLSYLLEAVAVLKKHFASISIEVYPMETEDYRRLKDAGVDGLTVYQEVYDPRVYREVHPGGRKADYAWRLGTPERGAKAGFRAIGLGPLYGLGLPETEAFFAALHAKHIQDNYPDAEAGLSLPRLNEAEGGFKPLHPMGDRQMVQFLVAFRLFLPRAGITISTRERASFRDRLVPLGITRLSAGSVTRVGGYATDTAGDEPHTPQFEVSDSRSVAEVAEMVRKSGYEPVFKDWEML